MTFYTNTKRYGSSILHRYVDDQGVRHSVREKYEPTLYVVSNEETGWKTIKNIPVRPKKFASIQEARDFLDSMSDIRPDVIHGIKDFDLSFIHENYPEKIEYDYSKIKTFFLDIEVEARNGFPHPDIAKDPINAITIYDSIKRKYYTFSYLDTKFEDALPGTLFVPCSDERQMLQAFVSFWARDYPDIVTGWNSNGFDIPYIINRLTNLFGESFTSKLSPFGKIDGRKGKNSFGQDCVNYEIFGIELLDMLDLYKKFTIKNQESYKLDFIAQIEIGEGKVDFDGSLVELADSDPNKFLKYNQYDVYLLVKMNAKIGLLSLCTQVAYLMKANYSDALGTVRPWTSKIADVLLREKVVIDAYHRPFEDTTFEAAYVKDPIPGRYKAVATLDATSMYPHQIMGENISPEKKLLFKDVPDELKQYYGTRFIETIENDEFELTELLVKHNLCMSPNGMFYRLDGEGYLPRIIKVLFALRKEKKDEMLSLKRMQEIEHSDDREATIRALDVMQNSVKVAMNSLFGALGNKHFPLFDLQNAEAITFGGQAGIRFVSKRISQWISNLCRSGDFKDYVIYIDTDSLAINLDDLIKKFNIDSTNVDELCKLVDEKLNAVAEEASKEFAKLINMSWAALQFKREKIATNAVYVKKKKYFMLVHDSEGVRYAEPELAITGLETNRSSTPKFVRDELKKALMLIVDDNESGLQKLTSEFREVYRSMDYNSIAFPSSINDMEKYSDPKKIYGPRCPIAVRAALLHNHYVKNEGLDKKYQLMHSGEKIRYVFLTLPNKYRENVFAYIDKIPPEFGLESLIDYEEMFMKGFVNPLQNVCDAIGWSVEKRANLSAFF